MSVSICWVGGCRARAAMTSTRRDPTTLNQYLCLKCRPVRSKMSSTRARG
nr:MAG TPA: hypothetical protein [Caudoviricetes sp.]